MRAWYESTIATTLMRGLGGKEEGLCVCLGSILTKIGIQSSNACYSFITIRYPGTKFRNKWTRGNDVGLRMSYPNCMGSIHNINTGIE